MKANMQELDIHRLSPMFSIFIFLLFPGFCGYGQIISYTNATNGSLNSVATHATGTALAVVNGATTSSSPCGTGFSVSGFDTTSAYSTTLPAVEVTATPATGYALHVTSFSAGLRRSASGPSDVRYAYSTDGGTTWIDKGSNQSPDNASCGTTTKGTWTKGITITAPAYLKFRLYGFDASSKSGNLQILNLNINGTVAATTTCKAPTLSGTVTNDNCYGGTNGAISLTTKGGTSPFTYAWNNGDVTKNISTLAAGNYTVTVTAKGGCKATKNFTVTQPTALSATISQTNVACGGTNGQAIINVSGGTPGYSYLWTTSPVQTTDTATGLSAKAYVVTVQDSKKCVLTDTATIVILTPTGSTATNISSSAATLSWKAISSSASYNIQYRPTGTTKWTSTTSTTNSITIQGLSASTSYEFQVQTVCPGGSVSAFSTSADFVTNTITKIIYYFNHPVDTSVSTGVKAVYLDSTLADTLVAYINRAKYSIDVAQYDYIQTSSFANIATAINNAYARGVKIRWIYNGSSSNSGLASLNPAIYTLGSPTTDKYGIMHNKFMIIDAGSSNPSDALVWTGSADWSQEQIFTDYNNIVILQDSALAHVYTSEFNMMWGDTSIAPNKTLSKFGPYKTNLGRHQFTIGGNLVELYFSPSDSTDTHIQSSISSANTDMYFGMYTFTDTTDASLLVSKKNSGVTVDGIVDTYSTGYSAYPILNKGLGSSDLKVYNGGSSSIYHNKYLIVDPSNTCSDPQVLTGSHNWTVSANTMNDENTLIIHDSVAANIYYQAFKSDFNSLGGTLSHIIVTGGCGTVYENDIVVNSPLKISMSAKDNASIYPNPSNSDFTISYHLASAQNVTISISDITGQHIIMPVNNQKQEEGDHQYRFVPNARGVYFVRIIKSETAKNYKIIRM